MNFWNHIIGGILAFLVVNENIQIDWTLLGFLVALSACLLGTRLPDILEPPTHPEHRGFFHSYFILIVTALIGYLLFNSLNSRADVIVLFLLAGYESHLILDLPFMPIIF